MNPKFIDNTGAMSKMQNQAKIFWLQYFSRFLKFTRHNGENTCPVGKMTLSIFLTFSRDDAGNTCAVKEMMLKIFSIDDVDLCRENSFKGE